MSAVLFQHKCKKQKNLTRTNPTRAVYVVALWRKIKDKTRWKLAGFFSKRQLGFASETTIEPLKNYSKNPNKVKIMSFWLIFWKKWCKEKSMVNKNGGKRARETYQATWINRLRCRETHTHKITVTTDSCTSWAFKWTRIQFSHLILHFARFPLFLFIGEYIT